MKKVLFVVMFILVGNLCANMNSDQAFLEGKSEGLEYKMQKGYVSFEEAKKHCLEWLPYAQKVQLGARTDPETYVRACISFATMR